MTNSSVGEALLALQDCDSAIAKLQHQRTHSPDATAVADAERELAALAESLRVLQVEFTKAAEEHGAVDAELSACEKRLADLRGKLEHATGNSRDLMAMSEEVEHLSKQQSDLEDRVLAAMDVLEPLQATVEEISSKGRAVNAALGQARLALEAAHKQIEAELNMQVELRSTLAAAVAPAQLSEYDRMRKNMGGVAVARFSGSQCHGCDLNRHWGGAEIEQLRAQSAQSLGRCEDCGRIVVES